MHQYLIYREAATFQIHIGRIICPRFYNRNLGNNVDFFDISLYLFIDCF